MLHLFAGLDFHTGLLLLLALAFVLFYEAINGFHDTANAVATVIYTRALRSQVAVVMAAVFNFFGVLLGGLSVAYAIVHMLPTDLLLNVSSGHGLAMVFSLLFAAIIWNLGTWYFGLPASSSHTLIGAIIGIGLTNALMTGTSVVDALNIPKVIGIFGSLIISPIVGLVVAGGLIFLLRRYWSGTKKRARIHLTPAEREKKDGKKKPPFWTRIALIVSAIGVAFSHGANDGQKGIGLVMLVLIGVAPAGFVVNMNATGYEITRTRDAINNVETYFQQRPDLLKKATGVDQLIPSPEAGATQPAEFHCHPANAINALERAKGMLTDVESYDKLTPEQRGQMRRIMLCISDVTEKVSKLPEVSADDKRLLKKLKVDMLNTIEYAPIWIIMAVALALGLGTMVGWRRVATTIGEKIGKKGMTYAQGMSAQMTAAVSIGLASYTGMPVSTTHVLSSSVAGTMLVDGGGLQRKTVTSILMAWVFTLPASILLSGGLYWTSLQFL
ncbi:inorganic phosphate transporter PitA [Leclercia sp. 29361]|jgi:low-affinity inorganic phosphate transporter|uniref:Phosphate transporter n=1 Tax=Leclercia tamurae TaxID=2926467 RepID=A0ABT2R923_9ENTR|nr:MULTISPECIES: inorganic phosphate transporter PitA [Leclercia]MCT9845878.1 inorganic phosphate transporter PitA [Leclercia adecarboxylata ATCC 23216 = NBRC 102595]PSS47193.1 anion permease [Enterobacter sp. FS01]MCU6677382.1 inorganic phosphate transporter PitA [Leclercia tamurae]MCU6680997.1 inorganic phosphate transporter PitA [Leclercia tamurae]MDY0923895.1 inorganic phosphate transporter PitA [Leclercia sp. CFBP8987]